MTEDERNAHVNRLLAARALVDSIDGDQLTEDAPSRLFTAGEHLDNILLRMDPCDLADAFELD